MDGGLIQSKRSSFQGQKNVNNNDNNTILFTTKQYWEAYIFFKDIYLQNDVIVTGLERRTNITNRTFNLVKQNALRPLKQS